MQAVPGDSAGRVFFAVQAVPYRPPQLLQGLHQNGEAGVPGAHSGGACAGDSAAGHQGLQQVRRGTAAFRFQQAHQRMGRVAWLVQRLQQPPSQTEGGGCSHSHSNATCARGQVGTNLLLSSLEGPCWGYQPLVSVSSVPVVVAGGCRIALALLVYRDYFQGEMLIDHCRARCCFILMSKLSAQKARLSAGVPLCYAGECTEKRTESEGWAARTCQRLKAYEYQSSI